MSPDGSFLASAEAMAGRTGHQRGTRKEEKHKNPD